MASIEHLIVSKIIEEQSIAEAIKAGIRPFHFAGDWEDIYKYILDYNAKHGAVPSERAFSTAYGDVDIEDTSTETFSGLFEELMSAYKLRIVRESITNAMGPLNNLEVDKALSILSSGLRSASAETTRLRDFNIIEGWEERFAQYQEMREQPNALRGIPTGFYGLDRLTHGFRPQQFIVLCGEPKRGKSLFELIMANACHVHGLPPTFVSYEMSVAEQVSRWDALAARVPYDRILSGDLSDAEMDRIYRSMIQRKNMHPFMMSEDSTSHTTLSALDAKIVEYRPAALYVDGIYLMDDEEGEPKGTPQALTNISRGFKRLAQKHDIPIIATTQVLPWKIGNKRTRAITADSIGYTSAFIQDADLIIGVERNPDIDQQAILRIVEGRTVPKAEIHVQWDFSTMEFEEVTDLDPMDPSFD